MQSKLLSGLTTGFFVFSLAGVASAANFTDNFNDGDMDGWTQKIGSWSVGQENTLSNSGSVYGVVWKDDSFGVYQKIQVDAFFDFSNQNDRFAHLRLRTDQNDSGTQPFWDTGYLAQFEKNKITIQNLYMDNNPIISSWEFSDNNTPFMDKAWNELAFGVDGTGANTHFTLWVNGTQYIDYTYNNNIDALDSGYVGLGRNIHYDNVVGYSSSTPVPVPSSVFLLCSGIASLACFKIRKEQPVT